MDWKLQTVFSITHHFKNNESVIKVKEKYDSEENAFYLLCFQKMTLLKW